jgi:hypothetical protein
MDNRWRRVWWPRIENEHAARRAIRAGMWLALLMAAATAAAATFEVPGFGNSEFADAIFCLFWAIGLSRFSRLAAIGGVVYYLGSRVYLWQLATNRGPLKLVVSAFFASAFINAVRGSWFHHRVLGSRVRWKYVLILSGVAFALTIIVIVCGVLAMMALGDNSVEDFVAGAFLLTPLIPFTVLPLVSRLRTTFPTEVASNPIEPISPPGI